MLLYTYANDFAYLYHPDEPKKAYAITKDRLQFNHPLLLINTARLAFAVSTGYEGSHQQAARSGRFTSAFFAAAAIVLVASCALLLAGRLAMVSTAVILLFDPLLFQLAHYMKEDPALLVGLSACLTALVFYVRRPGMARALLLGAAAGLAVSGKFIGIYALLPALAATAITSRGSWRPRVKCYVACLAAAMVTFAICNYQMILELPKLVADLGDEFKTFDQPLYDQHAETPHLVFLSMLAKNSPYWLHAVAALGLLAVVLPKPLLNRQTGYSGVWSALFTLGYLGVLCFSFYTFSRYLLPLAAFCALYAGVGAAAIACLVGRVAGWLGAAKQLANVLGIVAAAALVIPLATNKGPQLITQAQRLHNDTRWNLYEYVRDELPPTAVIAQGKFAWLPYTQPSRNPETRPTLPHTVLNKPFLHSFGSLDQLRQLGATHFVAFSHYFREVDQGKSADSPVQQFYRELAANSQLVWQSTGVHGGLLAPQVELREITP